MNLTDTTKTLELYLTGAVTTNQLPFYTCYSDLKRQGDSVGALDGLSNNTTAVTIVAAPPDGVVRRMEQLYVRNNDTVNATVVVRLNNNGTARILFAVTLATGESLLWSLNSGLHCYTTAGAIK